jgi:hypothetical protein
MMTTLPTRFPWSNWIGDHASAGLELVAPSTADELVAIVRQAVADERRIRAVGAGHSTTSVARPDHIWVTLDQMQQVLPLEHVKSSRRDEEGQHVRIGAGTRLKTANRTLLGDKAVYNMGSFDWQSLIGAASTGTHGSGIDLGPIAESIVSVDMVTVRKIDGEPDVRMRRIEPTDGLTDRGAFEAAEREMELIQNDDTFYSCVVSFGCIGLVHSIVLKVRDAYWLNEVNVAMRWHRVRDLLELGPDGQLPAVLADNRHWEFLVNAAETKGKDATSNPMCLVRRRNEVAAKTKPDDWKDKHDWPPGRADTSMFQKAAEALIRPAIDDANGNILLVIDVGDRIRSNFEKSADKPPFEGDVAYSRNFWVLRRERDDTGPREEPDRPPQAISHEIAVPVENTVAAVDRILDLMRSSRYFYAVPFGVRFVAPSRHYLAPQYGRPTCMIEIPLVLPNNAQKRAEQLPDYKQALADIEDALCYEPGNLGGRPHWGQYNELNRQRLTDLYDKLPEFERVYSEHNAVGTFDNAYTRQLGLVRSEIPAKDPNTTALRIAVDHVLS